MSNNSRRTKALAILANTGMLRSNYEPPYLRLLWRLGFDVPPPHFVPFWSIASIAAVWFGSVWGLFMWIALWSQQGLPWQLAAGISAGPGLLFGLFMAAHYARGRRKHRLPDWHTL